MKIKHIQTGKISDVKVAFLKANRDIDISTVLDRKKIIEEKGYITTESVVYTSPSKCKEIEADFTYFEVVEPIIEVKQTGAKRTTKITGFDYKIISSDEITDENTIVVLDGQHRLIASMLINNDKTDSVLPTVNKLEDSVDVFEYIKLVNNERKPWKATDYLKAVAVKNELSDIYELLEYAKNIGATPEVLLNFCTLPTPLIKKTKLAQLTTASKEDVKKIITECGFTKKNFEIGKKLFEKFEAIEPKVKNNTSFARAFKLHYSSVLNELGGTETDNYIKWILEDGMAALSLNLLFTISTPKQLREDPNDKHTYESNLIELVEQYKKFSNNQ